MVSAMTTDRSSVPRYDDLPVGAGVDIGRYEAAGTPLPTSSPTVPPPADPS